MTDAEKLAAITELVDGWNNKYGPGSHVENVMGEQLVSIEFVHKKFHEILDQQGTP